MSFFKKKSFALFPLCISWRYDKKRISMIRKLVIFAYILYAKTEQNKNPEISHRTIPVQGQLVPAEGSKRKLDCWFVPIYNALQT